MKLACLFVLVLGCGGGAAKPSPAAPTAPAEAAAPAAPAPAPAPAPADPAAAEKANEAGKTAMFSNNNEAAVASFEKAYALDPKPIYAFNLCVAQYTEGRFADAKRACKNALSHGPDATVEAKATKMLERIENEAKAQGVALPN
jgi:tetratricopeptide (TPR) repeat protein